MKCTNCGQAKNCAQVFATNPASSLWINWLCTDCYPKLIGWLKS